MRQLLTAFLILGLSTSSLADDEAKEPDWTFKSKTAQAAMKQPPFSPSPISPTTSSGTPLKKQIPSSKVQLR